MGYDKLSPLLRKELEEKYTLKQTLDNGNIEIYISKTKGTKADADRFYKAMADCQKSRRAV